MNKIYCAYRRSFVGAICSVNSDSRNYLLTPCIDRLHITPHTFDWSQNETGGVHLSFAILADYFANDPAGKRTPLGDCLAGCLYARFQIAYLRHRPGSGFVLTADGLSSILRPLATDHREPLVIAFSQLAANELAQARAAGKCPELRALRTQYTIALLSSLKCGVAFINTLFAEAHLDQIYEEAVA